MSLVASYFQPGTTNPFSFLTGHREGYEGSGGTSISQSDGAMTSGTLVSGDVVLTISGSGTKITKGSQTLVSISSVKKSIEVVANSAKLDDKTYVDPVMTHMCSVYFWTTDTSPALTLTSYGDLVYISGVAVAGLASTLNFSLARYALEKSDNSPIFPDTTARKTGIDWKVIDGGVFDNVPLPVGSSLKPWTATTGTAKSGLLMRASSGTCPSSVTSMQFQGGTATAWYGEYYSRAYIKIWDLKTLLGYETLIPAPSYMVLTTTKLVLSKDAAGSQIVHTIGEGFTGAENMCLGANGDLLIVDSDKNILWSLYVEACTRINTPAAGAAPAVWSLATLESAYKSANAAYSNITALYTKLKTYDTQVAGLVSKIKISDISGSLVAQNTATVVHSSNAGALLTLYSSNNVNYTSNISIIEKANLADFTPTDKLVAKKIQDSAKASNVTMIAAMHRSDFGWKSNSRPMTLLSNINDNRLSINAKVDEIKKSINPVVVKLKDLFDTNSGKLRTSPFKTNKFQNTTGQSIEAQYSNVVSVRSSLATKQPAVKILSNTLVVSSATYGSNNVTGYLGYLAKDSDSKFKLPGGVFSNLNGIFGLPLTASLPLTVAYTINGVTQNKTFTKDPIELGKSVNIDCVIGWNPCTNADPLATAGTQSYGITTQPFGTGAKCSTVSASNTRACVMPVVNCTGSFGTATECVGGVQSKIYSIVTNRSGGGLECPHPNGFIQTSNCKPTVDCVGGWSGWGDCDPTSSTQAATYSVTTEASGAGKACPATDGQTKSRACKPGQPAPKEDAPDAPPEAAAEKSFFEQYGLYLGGGCCCCLILLVLFFIMSKKKS